VLIFDIDFPLAPELHGRTSWSIVDEFIVDAVQAISTIYPPKLPLSPGSGSDPTYPGETLWAFANITKAKGLHKITITIPLGFVLFFVRALALIAGLNFAGTPGT